MIFKTIDDDSTLSGQRIVSVFEARRIAQEKVNASLREHAAQLEIDKAALTSLEQKVSSGTTYEEAYAQSMKRASVAAKEHAVTTKGVAGTTDTFVAKQKKAQAELEATATSSKVAAVGVKALKLAFNMFSGLVISFAISKIIEGFQYLSESAERAKEKLEDIRTDLTDNQSSYESNRKTLEGLRDEYDSLTKKADELGGVQNLANEEYQRYTEIMSQILGITPKLTTGWDDEGNAISNKNGLLQQSIDLLDEEYEKSLRNNTTKKKNEEVSEGIITELKEFESSGDTKSNGDTINPLVLGFIKSLRDVDVKNKKLDDYDIAKQLYTYLYPDAKDLTELSQKTGNWIDRLQSVIYDKNDYEKLAKSFTEKDNPIYDLFPDDAIDQMIENANEYFQELDRIQSDRETYYQKYKDQLNWNAQAVTDNSGKNAYKQLSDESKTALTGYIDNLDYASIKTSDDFVDMANNVKSFTKLLASDSTLSDYMSDIYTPQGDDESIEDYSKRVNDAIEEVKKYIKDNNLNVSLDFGTDENPKGIKESVDKLEKFYDQAIDRFSNHATEKQNKAMAEAKQNLQDEYDKITGENDQPDFELGDYADQIKNKTIQTVFGNVDMDKRTIIHWSDELKQTYADALASWDYDPEVGTIDTVFGMSDRFGEGFKGHEEGWEVAFTPILPDGTFLSKDTVSEYINQILTEAYADDGKVTEDELTDIDAQGRQVGDTFVKGIFAGIDDSQNYDDNGNWAELVGRLMHFSGKFGAIQIAEREISDLEKQFGKDGSQTIKDFFNTEGINTQDEIDAFNDVTKGINDADKAIQTWNEHKKESNEAPIPSTFKDLWKSIGKGDDDASKAAKSAKEEILKLAEAGKLTEKAFKKSSIADTFTNAGYSIKEATKKINRMVDSSKQLSSLKSSISSIQNAYQEKKDNKVANSSTLAGMEDIFGKLSSWEKYKNILGSASSTLKECKIAQNELATEFVYSNNFLSQLTSKNKEYYTSQLKELGIANAQSIVENTLKAKKQALANETKALEAATSDLSGETSDASEKFLEQANMTNLAKVELFDLIVKEKIFANTDLNANQKIKQLSELAKAYFNVGIGISTAMGGHSNYYKSPEDYETAVNNEYDDLIKQQTKISIDPVKVSPKNDTKDKSSNSNSKDTKQEIDWLSRRLTRMQSIIDLTASKLKNLFKIDEKENNINKQIKQTTKLINQYGHAYDVYMSKANKIAKASGKGKNKVPALSKDIINKIQSGEITKSSYKKLIKKYGKDYADKINEYIDYYDKAQDSLKSKEEQIANKRELKKSKIQLRIDDAQSKIDRADSRIENATSASEKNKILDNEKKYYKELYNQKIKQAELDEDSVEVGKLKAEQKKQERDLSIEQHQNNIDEKQSALDVLEAQKENVTSASEKNAIIDQELALKKEICNEELAIAKLNGDQNEQERLKKQLLFEEKKAQLEQIANMKDEFDLKKNALSRDEAELQQQIAENEAKGVGQSIKDYRKQIALSEGRQKKLRDEKEYWEAYLAEQLASGKIVANESDAAYKELKDNIASCDEGISSCIVDQINWNKAIREMNYKNYETLLDLLDMAYKKLENLKSIREAHGKELTDDEILKLIKIDDKIINTSKSAMESVKKSLSDAFTNGDYGFKLNTEQIDEFMDYLEYAPDKIPNLMKSFGIENFNKDTYSGIFDEIEKFTTNNDNWVQALVDAEGLSDEIGQKIIDHANEYLEALKKQKEYKDRIFAIEKAQYDLEKAKNNLTKKVWDGQQWVYTADTEAVQSAQETLDNTMFELFNNSIQDLIEVIEQFNKDFNIYNDNGDMINNPKAMLNKGVLGKYTIVDIDKIFTDKVLDTSKLSGLMSNIQYATPNVSIPNINLPKIQSKAMNQTVNYDKIELILPNITDASTGADLTKSFVNELKNLSSYAKQYDWNK